MTAATPGATVSRSQVTSPASRAQRGSEFCGSNSYGAGSRSVSSTPVASDGPVLVTVTLKAVLPPAAAVSASAVLVRLRSARRWSGVVVESDTSAPPPSRSVEVVATAVLVTSEPVRFGATVPVTVISAGCTGSRVTPARTVPSAHRSRCATSVQAPCEDVMSVGTRPAGRASVTTTSSALELSRSTWSSIEIRPARTAIRYEKVPPATSGVVSACLSMIRSATGSLISTVRLSELSARFVSVDDVVTRAVFVYTPWGVSGAGSVIS